MSEWIDTRTNEVHLFSDEKIKEFAEQPAFKEMIDKFEDEQIEEKLKEKGW